MRLHLLLHLFVVSSTSTSTLKKRDYASKDYYAVHVDKDSSIDTVAARLGLAVHGQIGELQDHYLLEGPKQSQDVVRTAIQHRKRNRRRGVNSVNEFDALDSVLLAQKQQLRRRLFKRDAPGPFTLDPRLESLRRADSKIPPVNTYAETNIKIAKELGIKDPIYQEQWHHFNSVQIGHDLNVTGVWREGVTGKNSTSCIVDDGLDFGSDDLIDNYSPEGSHDFNNQGPDPLPRLSDDRHGTRCAGEIAAVKNDVCGVGIAYDGKVSGVRILSAAISDVDEAVAMNYAYQVNQIYSCSWGPPDDGKAMDAPGILIKRAMLNGIQNGRGGYGSLFVFAIGNGAHNDDNCNFDGYTNSIYSVSVGAVDRKGLHPYYSEKCSAQLVVTYSSGSGDAIHTTDVGKDTCYAGHGGTSAAGPLVAGVYALIQEVRPDLHWRDFQWLTALTAIPVNTDTEKDWQDTPLGLRFSHQYGYGKIDAYKIVQAAKTWQSIKPQAWYFSPWLHVKEPIPQGKIGLTSSFEVTKAMLADANLERLEHVTVTMNVEHRRRGDLSVDLISPAGIVSHIATTRKLDDAQSGYVDWTFMSVAHFGESGIGKWTVVVKDTNVNKYSGIFTDWRLRLWGECVDPKIQKLLPMPTEHDDDAHDTETISATVGTTMHGEPPKTDALPDKPSDHPERPVNAKPTTTDTSNPTDTSTSKPGLSDDGKTPQGKQGLLPSMFPTFGASKSTQVWIYGALGLILSFGLSLGIWHLIVRRRRQRNARDEYEFEMLDDQDRDDSSDPLSASGRKGKGRAGELYDAFAEGSEDEHDRFSVGDEDEHDEDGEYRDVSDSRRPST